MSAAQLPRIDDKIRIVVQWKDMIDAGSPWWRKLYYHTVYKWFLEFSLKVMKVPNPTQVTHVDGKQITFSWLEWQGFFPTDDEARAACLEARWGFKALPFGRLLPKESGQCVGEWIFPRAQNPTKRAPLILSHVIKDRKKDEQERATLAEALQQLNQVLDR